MAPRTRRVSARLADLRPEESEQDNERDEDEIDVENGDEEQDVNDDEDGDGEEDEEDEDDDEDDERDEIQSDEEEDEDEEPIPSPRKSQPRLRIKLKLGANRIASSTNSTARPTPEVETTPSRTRTRRKTRIEDVESEESLSPESEDGVDSTAGPHRHHGRQKPMTTRQAVLASVMDSSHVSLDDGNRSKKKILNENELALRREETARKRKNLTEKKLEDEKAETINRLLKKQTRPRNKRGTALDDRSPMPTGNRKLKLKVKEEEGEEGEEGGRGGGGGGGGREEEVPMEGVQEEVKPVMYRWVSSKVADEEAKMVLSFSVPPSALPSSLPSTEAPKIVAPASCAVEGCEQPRKYRLVKDWTVGACGMAHLKLLEG